MDMNFKLINSNPKLYIIFLLVQDHLSLKYIMLLIIIVQFKNGY